MGEREIDWEGIFVNSLKVLVIGFAFLFLFLFFFIRTSLEEGS